jgi:hypothetical protein
MPNTINPINPGLFRLGVIKGRKRGNPILKRNQWTKKQLPVWLSSAGITSAKPLAQQVHKLILHEMENNRRKRYAEKKLKTTRSR